MANGPCVCFGGQLDRAAMHNIHVTAGVYRPACISEYFPIVFIKPESFVNTEGNGSLIHMR
jgi:hypothetical protein